MKNIISQLALIVLLFSCSHPAEETKKEVSQDNNSELQHAVSRDTAQSQTRIKSPVSSVIIDTSILEKVWDENVLPIIHSDKNKLKSTVYFPLDGDWGNIIKLNKSRDQWTGEDFFNNLDKLFYPELIDKLKKMNFKDLSVYLADDGEKQLTLDVNFEEMIGDFKSESTVILRFREVNQRWMLYAIFAAG